VRKLTLADLADYADFNLIFCHPEERGIPARSSTKIGEILNGATCGDLLRQSLALESPSSKWQTWRNCSI